MSMSEQLDLALREWVKVFIRRSMHEFHRSQKAFGLLSGQLRTLTDAANSLESKHQEEELETQRTKV